MVRVVSSRALEFACNSKACAPPPVGTGGSKTSGGKAGSRFDPERTRNQVDNYANRKLAKSGGVGDNPDIDWSAQPTSSPDFPMKGVVTTPGGRKYAVAWDEHTVGPLAAKEVIGQYSKLMDLYPELDIPPLAIGSTAVKEVYARAFGGDISKVSAKMDASTGFVVKDGATGDSRMVGFTAGVMRDDLMKTQPDMWGVRTKYMTPTQARQYVVTHEVGHLVHQHWERKASPMQRISQGIDLDLQADTMKTARPGSGNEVIDIGRYGKSSGVELVAEAFAMQSHGLSTRDTSKLRDVTDFMLGGQAPRKVEWTS